MKNIIKLSEAKLKKFCGYYKAIKDNYFRKVFLKDGSLYYYRNENSYFKLTPISTNEFIMLTNGCSKLSFEISENSKKMIFKQKDYEALFLGCKDIESTKIKRTKKIPKMLLDVTPSYLTKLFKNKGYLTRGRVVEVSSKGNEVSFRSNCGHLTLTYSERSKGERPGKIFVKLSEYVEGIHEIDFYKFLSKQKVKLDVVAKCYFAEYYEKQKASVLILKDYSDIHEWPIELSTFHPRKNIPSDEHFFGMVEAIAEFHAFWWEKKSLFNKENNFEISHWLKEDSMKRWIKSCKKDWKKFYVNEKNWLSKDIIATYEILYNNLFTIWEKHLKNRSKQKQHFTLINGDAYMHQFLCLSKGSGEKYKVIDLEGAHICNPMIDLVHLLVKTINPAQRISQNREKRLLKHYNKTLRKHGVLNYAFNQMMIDYRMMVAFTVPFALWDYSYQGSDDQYWWAKFLKLNYAYSDLKCSELFDNKSEISGGTK